MKHETKVYIAGATALVAMLAFFFSLACIVQETDSAFTNAILGVSGLALGWAVTTLNQGEER